MEHMRVQEEAAESRESLDTQLEEKELSIFQRVIKQIRDGGELFQDRWPKSQKRKLNHYVRMIGLATMMTLSSNAVYEPEADFSTKVERLDDSIKEIKKETAESVSVAEADDLTKQLVQSIEAERSRGEIGASIYGYVLSSDKKNNDKKYLDQTQGELPTRAENIVVRGGSIIHVSESVVATGSASQTDIRSNMRHIVNLSHTAQGYTVVPIGDPITMEAEAGTGDDALRQVLTDSAMFLGERVSTEQDLQHKSDGETVTKDFKDSSMTTYNHAIASYRVVEAKETKDASGDALFRVKISIQPGTMEHTGALHIVPQTFS